MSSASTELYKIYFNQNYTTKIKDSRECISIPAKLWTFKPASILVELIATYCKSKKPVMREHFFKALSSKKWRLVFWPQPLIGIKVVNKRWHVNELGNEYKSTVGKRCWPRREIQLQISDTVEVSLHLFLLLLWFISPEM